MERLEFLKQLAMKYGHIPMFFSGDTTLESLGMDSYDVVDFMLEVEQAYGITADDDSLLSVKTVGDVLALINQCMKEEETNHA